MHLSRPHPKRTAEFRYTKYKNRIEDTLTLRKFRLEISIKNHREIASSLCKGSRPTELLHHQKYPKIGNFLRFPNPLLETRCTAADGRVGIEIE
ncbi:hypothetical protein [Pseudorhodoplanes sinuspersici]|uniref:hypothetical protein n=1 Tax=Pseudorhodoplanes sinuspersici TaxID=1235591 RepID=UPI000FEEDFE7|nr:hypothetical protein [Pseudorhodoplanes sinuspersici]RKE70812.1 hypothetical protein DFP91_3060 [Pseudorhodoplanes sinuspersici]